MDMNMPMPGDSSSGGSGGHNHAVASGSSSSSSAHQAFCLTPGTSMYAGLTYMAKGGEPCFMFLFQSAVADTRGKYALAILGAFLLGVATEALRCVRNITRRRRPAPTKHPWRDLVVYTANESVLFCLHMTLAYAVMLLVMSFEWLIITGIILGLAAGFFGGEVVLLAAYLHTAVPKGKEANPGLGVGNAPCCDMGEEEGEVEALPPAAMHNKGKMVEEEEEFVHG